MGPRLIRRGKADRTPHARVRHVQASIGPRLLSRGVRVNRRIADRPNLASMGPRLTSRGVGLTPNTLYYVQVLQWGRGSISRGVASNTASRVLVPVTLQWGRG